MTVFLLGLGCAIVGFPLALAVLWWDWTLEDRRSGK